MSIENLPHSAKVRHKNLPKASLINIRFLPLKYPVGRQFMRVRGANFSTVWIWRFEISIRRSWLAGPARQLHPELFEAKP
jgi:hypothetical protein